MFHGDSTDACIVWFRNYYQRVILNFCTTCVQPHHVTLYKPDFFSLKIIMELMAFLWSSVVISPPCLIFIPKPHTHTHTHTHTCAQTHTTHTYIQHTTRAHTHTHTHTQHTHTTCTHTHTHTAHPHHTHTHTSTNAHTPHTHIHTHTYSTPTPTHHTHTPTHHTHTRTHTAHTHTHTYSTHTHTHAHARWALGPVAECRLGMRLTPHFHLVPWLRMGGTIPPYTSMACTGE